MMLKFDMKAKKGKQENKSTQKYSSLGASLFLKGELKGEEDLVIEGKFQGKIDLRDHNLIVEQGGKIKADIQVKNVTINGEVSGNIYASGKVFISKEGQMKGDILAPRISIADGAQFKGSVKMEKDIEIISPPQEKFEPLSELKKTQEKEKSIPNESAK